MVKKVNQKIKIGKFFWLGWDVENKNPKVIVGRLKLKYQYTLKDAIPFLKSKIGIDYDDAFIINNNSYYCSELIYEAFEKDSIFNLQPMTFLHPESADTLDILFRSCTYSKSVILYVQIL